MPDLPTEDLPGVEILSVGGPIYGAGSPPEGDYWTAEDLRAMAEAAAELRDEMRVPAKIGHSDTQALARAGLTEGEMPAVGWLDNIRTSDDGTKLLADIRKVPQRFAQLVRAGAWRTRSTELSKVTSQRTGKTYDWVVSGLAWLGGKQPAVKTLADVLALYEGDGERVRVYSEDVAATDDLRDAVAGLGIELAATFSRGVSSGGTSSDSGARMAETKLTEEQRRKFAEALGVKPDELTDEQVQAAEAIIEPVPPPPPDDDEDKHRELEETRRRALDADDRSRRLEEELRLEKRRSFVESVINGPKPKITPGQRDTLETLFDRDPEAARKFVDELPVRDDLIREYGTDDDLHPGETDEQRRDREDREYADDAAIRFGLSKEQVR